MTEPEGSKQHHCKQANLVIPYQFMASYLPFDVSTCKSRRSCEICLPRLAALCSNHLISGATSAVQMWISKVGCPTEI